jgi:hypothetical protein
VGDPLVPDQFREVPQALRDRHWIIWRWNDKGKKQPIAGWGSLGSPLTFVEAARRLAAGEGDGIGVILGDGLGGVDLDACIGAGGRLTDWAAEVLEQFDGTYAEISPSGTGIKVFALGAPERLSCMQMAMGAPLPGQGKHPAIEAYVGGRLFTVTGRRWGTAPTTAAELPGAWAWLADKLGATTTARRREGRPPEHVIEPEDLEVMLERVDVEQYRDYRPWWDLMASCHHATDGLGREVFIAWSISDAVFSDHAEIIGDMWDRLDPAGGIGWSLLCRALREAGASDLIPVEVRTLRYVDPYEGAEVVDESERYND